MEHGNAEPARERVNVSRNQNVMYVLPSDSAAIGEFMGPVLEQIAALETADQVIRGPRVVVVTPDGESAVAIGRAILESGADEDAPRAVVATSAARAARLLAARQAPIVVGPGDQLLELVRRAALKLDDVRAVVIAWADLLVDAGGTPALEALMGEMPKDSARTVVATRSTPEVEVLVERYARRPRRVLAGEMSEAPVSLAVRYIVTGRGADARGVALRGVLDALDAPSAAIFVRSAESAREVRDVLRTLGYGEDDAVRVVREAPSSAALVVLYDFPSSRSELEALAASAPSQVVAMVQPRQLPALVSLAGGGQLSSFSLDASILAARSSDARLRDELRAVLAAGLPVRELMAIEPLFGDFDAASVAAAALVVLERERRRPPAMPNAAPNLAPNAAPNAVPNATPGSEAPPPRTAPAGGPARVFVNVGERDGVSARDLVGAIANESGLAGSRIGRIEIRENHSIVELDAADAARAIEALAGVNIRGRRVNARLDRDRPPRDGAPRGERRDREDRGERRERPARGAAGGSVGRPRGSFPRRPGTRDRGPSRRRDE